MLKRYAIRKLHLKQRKKLESKKFFPYQISQRSSDWKKKRTFIFSWFFENFNFSAKKVKEQRLLAEKRKAEEEAKRLEAQKAKEAEQRRLAEESTKVAQYEMSPQGIFSKMI